MKPDRKLPPRPGPDASEADWQWWVCARVEALDGEWFHVGDSLRAKVPDGWPDLVLLLPRLQLKGGRTQRQLVRECKLDGEEPTEAQHRWLAMFMACGVDAAVWHFPSDAERAVREIGWREPVSPIGESVGDNPALPTDLEPWEREFVASIGPWQREAWLRQRAGGVR